MWVLVSVVGTLLLVSCGEQPPAWNVLLVTLDTTRADHLGCYGNETIETPNLDRLAAEGVRFEWAFSSAPITAPSHSTILTGRYPMAHGVRDNGLFNLGAEQETLAEILLAAGYDTGAAVGAFPLDSQFGLDQGFELYDDHFTVAFENLRGQRIVPKRTLFFDERRASLVNEAIYPWLEQRGDKPFFAWVHYFDPHQPYEPPTPYSELYANDLYDGEIAFADEALGALLHRLEALDLRDNTLVVVTADHGEGLGEHNENTHSTLLYNSTLHVPLIISVPGQQESMTIGQRVGTVDIAPTILDLLQLEAPEVMQGKSLSPLIESKGAPVAGFPSALYAETLSPRLSQGLGELRVLFDRQYKYIFGPRPELYDLEEDSRERMDLSALEPDAAAGMYRRLDAFLQAHTSQDASTSVDVDPETRKRLEALGYLQGGGGPVTINERLDGSGIAPQDRVGDVNQVSTAKHFLNSGEPARALPLFENLLASAPDSAYYLELKAVAQLNLNQIDDALETIERIQAVREGGLSNQALMLQLSSFLYYDGRAEVAIDLLEEHLPSQPTANGYWHLASLHARQGDPTRSIEAIDEALTIDPHFGPARVDLAIRHARAGDLPRAQRELEQAIADHPYYSKAHFNLGALMLQRTGPAAARQHFERALTLAPGYVEAQFALLTLALDANDITSAERYRRMLLSTAPNSPQAAEARRLLSGAPWDESQMNEQEEPAS